MGIMERKLNYYFKLSIGIRWASHGKEHGNYKDDSDYIGVI